MGFCIVFRLQFFASGTPRYKWPRQPVFVEVERVAQRGISCREKVLAGHMTQKMVLNLTNVNLVNVLCYT